MDEKMWFVGVVSPRKEKYCKEQLSSCGYEVFVPIQRRIHKWSRGRCREIDHIVVPGYIFINCSENERQRIFAANGEVKPLIYGSLLRFLMTESVVRDTNGKETSVRRLAVVPSEQIEQLRFMIGATNTAVMFDCRPYIKGDKVRVVRGDLMGLEGWIEKTADGKSNLLVRVNCLGCAKVEVNQINVEHVQD